MPFCKFCEKLKFVYATLGFAFLKLSYKCDPESIFASVPRVLRESNRRGKPWIRGFWLRKVFRGGARGAREGCTRRSARVFRAHNSPYGSNETSKIIVFKGPLKKCSAKVHAVLKCKHLNYQIYCSKILLFFV